MNKILFFSAIAAFMLVSCGTSNDDELSSDLTGSSTVTPPDEVTLYPMTFTATIGGTTRSVMNGGAGDGTHPLFWTQGDKIGVIGVKDYHTPCVHEFILTEGAGTSSGKFAGSADAQSEYHVLHPVQSWVRYESDKTSYITLPAIQTATDNTYDPAASLMVGNATELDKVITFKNVVSFMRVKPKYDCKSITIVANGTDQYLTGSVDVTYNNGEPQWTPSRFSVKLYTYTAMSNKVTLKGDIKANVNYYIAVLPGVKNSGFTVIVETCDRIGAKRTTASETLERSMYHDLTAMYPATFIDKYVDLGTTMQWSTRNLGALMPYDTGYFYAWGEIAAMGQNDPANHFLIFNRNTSTKFFYDWETYKWGKGSDIQQEVDMFSKYGNVDKKNILDDADDAAYTGTCGTRMPTKADFEELMAKCYWVYTSNYSKSNVGGFIVYKRKDGDTTEKIMANYKTNSSPVTYSTSDVHIFLPFTGYYQDSGTVNESTTHGYYWSKDLYLDDDSNNPSHKMAWDLFICNDAGDGGQIAEIHYDYRRGGQCIRPVKN